MSEGTPIAAAIRALAAQYRDLAIAEELDHIAIKADQYPEMPATGRMQRALWDAEEVLLQRLADIQSGINVLQATQQEHGVSAAQRQASLQSLAADLAVVMERDATQYADGIARIDRLEARLDRIEQSLVARDLLLAQHANHEARLVALEHSTQAPDDDD